MAAEQRLLPYLATACLDLLGGEMPSPSERSEIASKAKTGQVTVDRFLKGERTPRGVDLDQMVSAVAEVKGVSWLVPWQSAVGLALEAEVDQRLEGYSTELLQILEAAVQRSGSTSSRTAKSKP